MLKAEMVRLFTKAPVDTMRGGFILANKSTEYKNKYNSTNYDSLRIVVPKGKKSAIEDVAKSQGESINGYVKKSLKTQIKADTGQDIEL